MRCYQFFFLTDNSDFTVKGKQPKPLLIMAGHGNHSNIQGEATPHDSLMCHMFIQEGLCCEKEQP